MVTVRGGGQKARADIWHQTPLKPCREHGVISLLTVIWNDRSSEVVALSRPTGALNIQGRAYFMFAAIFFLILSLWNIFALVSNINKEIRYFLLCLDVWKLPFDPYGCWNMNHKKSFQPEFPALLFLFSRLHMWFYSHKQICYFLWYQSVSCIWKCKLKC